MGTPFASRAGSYLNRETINRQVPESRLSDPLDCAATQDSTTLLGGRDRNIDWYRQGGLRRHVYKMELKALDEERAEARRREE